MPESKELQSTFEFPERLTVRAYDRFQRARYDALKKAGVKTQKDVEALSVIMYQAISLHAAIEAGLILNWKSALQPELKWQEESDIDSIHVGVMEWAGQCVIDWIDKERRLPKVSFWRWLIAWTGRVFRRQNSSTPAA